MQELQFQAAASLREEFSSHTPRFATFGCVSAKRQTAMTQMTMFENQERVLKQCNSCHGWFEKTMFPPGRARCRGCHLKMAASSIWKSKLKHKYGITPEIHQAMYEDQRGKCYFCDVHRPSKGTGGLVIDHDKDTGFVRGLLCQPCNANWVDEYKKLPGEYQDSRHTNKYLHRGETGDYVESIKRRLASA